MVDIYVAYTTQAKRINCSCIPVD
uniref:Uncharacterized protein n=1 Tax=Anguilla anguilla TaxID=7936 RepID=A0A0E9S5W1_ANGAN